MWARFPSRETECNPTPAVVQDISTLTCGCPLSPHLGRFFSSLFLSHLDAPPSQRHVLRHANFNDHGRRMIPYTNMAMLPEAKVYLIANSVLVLVTLLVVALRVVSRVLAGSKLGWDDYFTLLAVPQGIVMLVLQGLCKSHDIVRISMNIRLNSYLRDCCRSWLPVVGDW